MQRVLPNRSSLGACPVSVSHLLALQEFFFDVLKRTFDTVFRISNSVNRVECAPSLANQHIQIETITDGISRGDRRPLKQDTYPLITATDFKLHWTIFPDSDPNTSSIHPVGPCAESRLNPVQCGAENMK
jgi:hypothetical protein